MVRCSAPNCKNNSSKSKRDDEGHQITYHMFPHGRPSLCNKWVDLLKEVGKDPNWFPSAHSKLCCVHFEKKYIIRSLSQTELASDAVPTIFAPSKSKVKCAELNPCTPVHPETGEEPTTVPTLPQIAEELYILNLLTEAHGSNNNSYLVNVNDEDPLMPSADNTSKNNFNSEQKLPVKETKARQDDANTSDPSAGCVLPNLVHNRGRLCFNPVELAIEIPDDSTNESSNASNALNEHVLCIAGSNMPNGGKVVSLHKRRSSSDALRAAPLERGFPEGTFEEGAFPDVPGRHTGVDAADTTEPMVVGGTKPFMADNEGMNRDHDYCGSLVDIVAKIKKNKLSSDSEPQDKDSKKHEKDPDIYCKIAMSDLLEALAQYELADIFSDPSRAPEDPQQTEDTDATSDVEVEYTQQEAVALADHFDASVANFFALEKADAAMPRLEAMIDSFMYFYGLTEADLGYVLHGSPPCFESEPAAGGNETQAREGQPALPATQPPNQQPPLTEPEAMEHDGEEEMEVLSNVVMVDTPTGGTHLMDLTTILEQADLEQFIDTLNI